eukprot:m.186494 g.186494  ORF g.186494 m.186494 type:complete len:373 (+) comp18139_c0_seq4:206-1324(+)
MVLAGGGGDNDNGAVEGLILRAGQLLLAAVVTGVVAQAFRNDAGTAWSFVFFTCWSSILAALCLACVNCHVIRLKEIRPHANAWAYLDFVCSAIFALFWFVAFVSTAGEPNAIPDPSRARLAKVSVAFSFVTFLAWAVDVVLSLSKLVSSVVRAAQPREPRRRRVERSEYADEELGEGSSAPLMAAASKDHFAFDSDDDGDEGEETAFGGGRGDVNNGGGFGGDDDEGFVMLTTNMTRATADGIGSNAGVGTANASNQGAVKANLPSATDGLEEMIPPGVVPASSTPPAEVEQRAAEPRPSFPDDNSDISEFFIDDEISDSPTPTHEFFIDDEISDSATPTHSPHISREPSKGMLSFSGSPLAQMLTNEAAA